MTKEIRKGDRIFARLTMGGKLILEFMINRVGSLSELLDELREMTGNLRGLGRLQIRNQSRGWSQERNLMFYGNSDNRSVNLSGASSADVYGQSGYGYAKPAMVSQQVSPSMGHMLFPWETH